MERPEQELIRQSWRAVSRSPLEHGTVLFARLFDLEPDLLPLFQYNCRQFSSPEDCLSSPEFLDHIRKVMLVIDAAVTNVEDLSSLEEYLAGLGRKHRAVGVKFSSFSTVGESLLYMLEKCLGPAFTPATRAAWSQLYGAVVQAMSRGWDGDFQGIQVAVEPAIGHDEETARRIQKAAHSAGTLAGSRPQVTATGLC